jgi:hypothetical protein
MRTAVIRHDRLGGIAVAGPAYIPQEQGRYVMVFPADRMADLMVPSAHECSGKRMRSVHPFRTNLPAGPY